MWAVRSSQKCCSSLTTCTRLAGLTPTWWDWSTKWLRPSTTPSLKRSPTISSRSQERTSDWTLQLWTCNVAESTECPDTTSNVIWQILQLTFTRPCRWREFCGLHPIKTWEELNTVMANYSVKGYAKVYASPEDLDLWSAGITERPLPGSMVGPTFACLIGKQFHNFRFGDRLVSVVTLLICHTGTLTWQVLVRERRLALILHPGAAGGDQESEALQGPLWQQRRLGDCPGNVKTVLMWRESPTLNCNVPGVRHGAARPWN